jgi:hypothetical protein
LRRNKRFSRLCISPFYNLKLINQPRIKNAEDDLAWITHVSIEIIAHPNLLESQQRMIRDEYFSGLASRIEYCRGCLVAYFIKDLNATLHPERDFAPAWLLAVANPEDVTPWLIQ